MIERCVITALLYAAAHPEALVAAVEVYLRHQDTEDLPSDLPGLRREKAALDTAIMQVGQDESAAVQAQIAGIRAGASPDAYQAVFADIAARRKDLENRRGAITRLLASPRPGKTALPAEKPVVERKALEDLARVLSSNVVSGAKKRDIVGTVIDHVMCQPDGADVYFLPGVGTSRYQALSDAPDTFNSTLIEYSIDHIQIVCRVRAGLCHWSIIGEE